ncbi:MAG: hypothetical protein ACM3OH_00550, partial [Bacillota bacterium]
MSRVARARRNATACSIAAIFVLGAAPSALAQFGAQLTPVTLASSYPGDWQKSNTLAGMQVFNGMGDAVLANIKVTIERNGVPVATTPPVPRLYPNGNSIVPTYNLTQWQTMAFDGKVGQAVDMSGRLPDGIYTVCVDITNIRTVSTGQGAADVNSCGNILSFTPKPPTPLFPADGSVVTSPSPVFQWAPIMSDLGRRAPHLFRLVEIYPGQTPQRAIEANRGIWEDAFPRVFGQPGQSSFTYPAEAPPLVSGHRYAWRVQAVYSVEPPTGSGLISVVGPRAGGSTLPVQAVGENEGKSRVFTFSVALDPAAAKMAPVAGGSSTDEESRMGNVWGPDGAPGGAGSAHDDETPGAAMSQTPAEPGAAEGVNFADRLAHAMASLWKQGSAAAVAAARGRAPGTDPRMSAAIPAPIVPQAAASQADARLAQADTRLSRAETRLAQADTRLAQGATQGIGPVPPPPAKPAPPPADSTAAAVDSTAAAQQAAVTTPAPSMNPGQSPGVGPGWAKLHGTTSVTGETYSSDGLAVPNRPDRSSRVVTGLSVGV